MAFCSQCGSRNTDGSRFCAECGAPIPVTAAHAPQPQSSLAQPNQAPPAYIPPQHSYTASANPQNSLAQPPRPPQVPPTYIPPQQSYTPPVQPVYTPPTPPANWSEEKPKKKFPWGIVIVLALLAVVVVGCMIADVVSDGELNLFGILEQEDDRDKDRDRDDREDEDEDEEDPKDPTKPGASEGPVAIPTAPMPMETVPMPIETVSPTEAPSEMVYYDITVWCSGTIADLTWEQINRFNSENDLGIFFNAYIMDVSEGDAGSLMAADVASGADLYCFAQDQTSRLMQAGALSIPDSAFTDFIYGSNDASSVSSASFYGMPCAYPMSNDNGYFMYYNKSIFSEDDVQSLETIIRRCEETGTCISFDLSNGWYLSSFFFATGCSSQWYTDDQGKFIAIDDTFCSEQGYIALQGMQKLLGSSCYRASSLCNDFSTGSSVVISGTWDYNTAVSILGSDLGVADLPSFEVNGTSYHLGSFSGCKLMGIKPQTNPDREVALHQLALYLTSQRCQEERFLYARPTSTYSTPQTYKVPPCCLRCMIKPAMQCPRDRFTACGGRSSSRFLRSWATVQTPGTF